MDDIISRQAAINALMPIYKSASLRNRNVFSTARKCMVTIEELPSIDAVQVIRCKDCKYYKENTLACGRYGLEDDDYCSWAERKES